MLISKVVYDTTGNSVANYTEYTHECKYCKGNGTLDKDISIFVSTTKELIICPYCDGQGKWTERK